MPAIPHPLPNGINTRAKHQRLTRQQGLKPQHSDQPLARGEILDDRGAHQWPAVFVLLEHRSDRPNDRQHVWPSIAPDVGPCHGLARPNRIQTANSDRVTLIVGNRECDTIAREALCIGLSWRLVYLLGLPLQVWPQGFLK